jgi:hypothetical protein
MGLFSAGNDPALTTRLTLIERKLDAILAHLGIELHGDNMDDIRDLIAQGQKIAAIKTYRERTGARLAEAKEAIERGL